MANYIASDKTALVGCVLINFTMLQSFVKCPGIVDPYWTLGYELWFYVVMTAVFAAGQIKNIDRLALCWLATMITFRGAMILGHGNWVYANWAVRLYLMPQFGHLFIAGMMLYRMSTDRATLPTLAALWLAVAYSIFGRPDWTDVSPLIYFAANTSFIAAVWAASTGRAAILASLPLRAIGVRSYSVYLLHVPIRSIVLDLAGDTFAAALVALILILIAASLSWAYIERPAQLWAQTIITTVAIRPHRRLNPQRDRPK